MKTSQLGKPAHSSDTRVTRVGYLAEVVHHLMSVVGPKRYKVIHLLCGLVNDLHRRIHVYIAVEMI